MRHLAILSASVAMAFAAPVSAAEFVVGPQTSTYDGLTRGYWFTAPAAFTITGLFIPDTASTGVQNLQVLRFTGTPTTYPIEGTNFSSLGLFLNQSATSTVATSISVAPGDVIGILGDRAGTNSYANGPATFAFVNSGLTINRLGFQGLIANSNGAQSAFTEEPGSYSRINFSYSLSGAVPEPGTWALLIVGFGFIGGAMRHRKSDVSLRYA